MGTGTVPAGLHPLHEREAPRSTRPEKNHEIAALTPTAGIERGKNGGQASDHLVPAGDGRGGRAQGDLLDADAGVLQR